MTQREFRATLVDATDDESGDADGDDESGEAVAEVDLSTEAGKVAAVLAIVASLSDPTSLDTILSAVAAQSDALAVANA